MDVKTILTNLFLLSSICSTEGYVYEILDEFGQTTSITHPKGGINMDVTCFGKKQAIRLYAQAQARQDISEFSCVKGNTTLVFSFPHGRIPRVTSPGECAIAFKTFKCGRNAKTVYACSSRASVECKDECVMFKEFIDQQEYNSRSLVEYPIHFINNMENVISQPKPIQFYYESKTTPKTSLYPGFIVFLKLEDMNKLSVEVHGEHDTQSLQCLAITIQENGPRSQFSSNGMKVMLDLSSFANLLSSGFGLIRVNCSLSNTGPSTYLFVASKVQAQLTCKNNQSSIDLPLCKPAPWMQNVDPISTVIIPKINTNATKATYTCEILVVVCFPMERIVKITGEQTCTLTEQNIIPILRHHVTNPNASSTRRILDKEITKRSQNTKQNILPILQHHVINFNASSTRRILDENTKSVDKAVSALNTIAYRTISDDSTTVSDQSSAISNISKTIDPKRSHKNYRVLHESPLTRQQGETNRSDFEEWLMMIVLSGLIFVALIFACAATIYIVGRHRQTKKTEGKVDTALSLEVAAGSTALGSTRTVVGASSRGPMFEKVHTDTVQVTSAKEYHTVRDSDPGLSPQDS